MSSLEYRNPMRNQFGTIDCEINHPEFGWIPFTAGPDDSEELGRLLSDEIEAAHADPDSSVSVDKYIAPPSTPDQVKTEANRRIVAICPEWKQRNLIAQATRLNRKPIADWTADEADQVAAGDAIWAQVEHIRAKSDEIEAMDPIPADITDDKLWA
ncbi:MAG: hypothetical protein AAFX90_10065 [Pseudomonadota bacterium]